MLHSGFGPMPQVLLVCTGNICRSPMAEGFLRSAFERRLGADAPLVVSAGLIARDGGSATTEAVRAAAELGADIADHTARRLLVHHARPADVVVGMAAEHRDEIVRTSLGDASKTFTLKELVRLLEGAPARPARGAPRGTPSRGAPAEGLAARIAEADRLRRDGFRGDPRDEDVADPLGMPLDGYRRIALQLDGWCERLAAALFDRSPVAAGREG